MLDYSKIPIAGFQGVWSKGNQNEVPLNHLVDSLNMRFTATGKVYTREGSSKGQIFAYPINDWFLSKRPSPNSFGTVSELLLCDGAGNIYNNNGVILTLAGCIGINAINLFSRTYFCPVLSGPGGGNGLWLYDGNQTRLAGGDGPSATPTMTISGITSGRLLAGNYTLWCSFETNTGFITPPGAQVSFNLSANSQFTVNSIPIGPTGTIARYLFITQTNGTIIYFIPQTDNGIINDNTTTSINLNFYVTDLSQSADYLQNLLTQIQSGGYAMGCIQYANRLVVWPGPVPGAGGSTAIISRQSTYESFDQTSCYVIVNRDDGFNIKTAFVWNNILYFCKDLGVYATNDNGQEPGYWSVNEVDNSVSIPLHGIAYLSSKLSPVDSGVLVADRSGLIVFSGEFQRPELTWKVASIWKSINPNAFDTIRLTVDPITQSIYCAIPINGATSPNYILYGDYSSALSEDLTYVNPMAMKWNLWKLPNNPTVIDMLDLTAGSYPILTIGSIDNIGNIINLNTTQSSDYGNNIQSYIQTAFLSPAKSKKVNFSDFVSLFAYFNLNAYGTSLLNPTLFGLNSNISINLPTIQLISSIGKLINKPINFPTNKLSIKLLSNSGQWNLDALDIYCKPLFNVTPG